MRSLVSSILALVVGTGLAAPGGAQTPFTEHTLALDDPAFRAPASIADVAWLTGRWVGEGMGAVAEEVWLPPAGGAMAGTFRLVNDGSVDFYELITLQEIEGSLVLRLKHFEPDLTGWEEKDEWVDFPLVRRGTDELFFDGLTIRRLAEDRMRVWLAFERDGEVGEALFEYRRADGTDE